MNRKGVQLALAIVSLGLAYAFASWAVDTGRWLYYFLAVVAIYVGLKYGLKLFKNGTE